MEDSTEAPSQFSSDHEFEEPKRLGTLSIVGFLAGLGSFLCLLSPVFLILCLLAMVLGAVAYIQAGRSESLEGAKLGGANLGLAALALGIFTGAWSVTARSQHRNYLYEQAQPVAKLYLDTLANGDKYLAHEFRLSEPERQLTGTNLAEIYEAEGSDSAEQMEEFLNEKATQLILATGPKADWRFARGIEIAEKPPVAVIKVEFQNESDLASPALQLTLVRDLGLMRTEAGEEKALWHVVAAAVLKDD